MDKPAHNHVHSFIFKLLDLMVGTPKTLDLIIVLFLIGVSCFQLLFYITRKLHLPYLLQVSVAKCDLFINGL